MMTKDKFKTNSCRSISDTRKYMEEGVKNNVHMYIVCDWNADKRQ